MSTQQVPWRITQLQYLLLNYVKRVLSSSTSNFFELRYGEVHGDTSFPSEPRPDALSPLSSACANSCVRVHQHIIPDDMGIPSPASPGPIGTGLCGLGLKRLVGVIWRRFERKVPIR
jgi:hypothetical protein